MDVQKQLPFLSAEELAKQTPSAHFVELFSRADARRHLFCSIGRGWRTGENGKREILERLVITEQTSPSELISLGLRLDSLLKLHHTDKNSLLRYIDRVYEEAKNARPKT
jgi:hypothetical protein